MPFSCSKAYPVVLAASCALVSGLPSAVLATKTPRGQNELAAATKFRTQLKLPPLPVDTKLQRVTLLDQTQAWAIVLRPTTESPSPLGMLIAEIAARSDTLIVPAPPVVVQRFAKSGGKTMGGIYDPERNAVLLPQRTALRAILGDIETPAHEAQHYYDLAEPSWDPLGSSHVAFGSELARLSKLPEAYVNDLWTSEIRAHRVSIEQIAAQLERANARIARLGARAFKDWLTKHEWTTHTYQAHDSNTMTGIGGRALKGAARSIQQAILQPPEATPTTSDHVASWKDSRSHVDLLYKPENSRKLPWLWATLRLASRPTFEHSLTFKVELPFDDLGVRTQVPTEISGHRTLLTVAFDRLANDLEQEYAVAQAALARLQAARQESIRLSESHPQRKGFPPLSPELNSNGMPLLIR